jgi:two-component system LytT family response regulator
MNQVITAIIVDDENHARQALAVALQPFAQLEVLAECANGVDAIKLVNELQPQVMFLDIHMPKLDGFDVLDLLGADAPVIVFVTAHDDYAIQAFDSNALDYLLKPLDPERLQKTISRIEQRLQADESHQLARVKADHQQSQAPLQRILVRDNSEVHVIPVHEVLYFESADDYVAIHWQERTLIKQDRLQHIENLVDPGGFCRIHRTCLLNLDYLAGIESGTKDTRFAILKNKTRLPISRSGYTRLKALL